MKCGFKSHGNVQRKRVKKSGEDGNVQARLLRFICLYAAGDLNPAMSYDRVHL